MSFFTVQLPTPEVLVQLVGDPIVDEFVFYTEERLPEDMSVAKTTRAARVTLELYHSHSSFWNDLANHPRKRSV